VRIEHTLDKPKAGSAWRIATQEIEQLYNFISLLDNMRTSQKATKPDRNHDACRTRFNSGLTATSVRLDQAIDKPKAGSAWRIATQEFEQLYKFA